MGETLARTRCHHCGVLRGEEQSEDCPYWMPAGGVRHDFRPVEGLRQPPARRPGDARREISFSVPLFPTTARFVQVRQDPNTGELEQWEGDTPETLVRRGRSTAVATCADGEPQPTPREPLRTRLEALLNAASAENGSNTPDHILAEYLLDCLGAYERAVVSRGNWYGHHDAPAQGISGHRIVG